MIHRARLWLIVLAVACLLHSSAAAFAEDSSGSSGKVDVLVESLSDEDPAVRRAAARGLGETRNKMAVPPLMKLATDDPEDSVRLAALGSLVMIGDKSALPAYEAALKDKSEEMRQGAAEALSGSWQESSHRALVDALKTDPSVKVRRSVAEALGNPGILGRYGAHSWDDSELTESALVMAVNSDKDYGVRSISARMLGKFKSKRSFNALIKAFTRDKNSSVRTAAAEALGELEMEGALAPLLEVIEFEDDEKVVAAALRALKYFENDKVTDAAVGALRSTSPMVRWQAIDVLEYQGSMEHEDTLRYIMDDDYEPEGVRHKAMEALQSMGLE